MTEPNDEPAPPTGAPSPPADDPAAASPLPAEPPAAMVAAEPAVPAEPTVQAEPGCRPRRIAARATGLRRAGDRGPRRARLDPARRQ